jgi:iron complex outermembrane receptor protein
MTKQILLLGCAVGVLASLAGGGVAAAAQASGQSATEVGAVIVTAEKREQNLQKVPVAVTAFTSKQRDTLGITTLQDMTNFTPGLTYTSTTDHLYVRGVGRQSINLAADAAVAAYTDGFYNPDPVLIVLPPMFIGSTEVLRGPQGTLSGRNGIGGSINVNSVRPTSTPYAEARVTLGNYGVHNEELAVSGPLADGLNFRLGGFDENQEQGYFKNVAGGPSEGGKIHVWYYEAAITAKLGDDTDLFVKAWSFGNKSRGGGGARAGWDQNPYGTALNDDSSLLSFNPAAAYDPVGNGIINVQQTNPSITGNPATANRYNFSGNFPLQTNNKQDGDVNFILTHHFPTMDLKYTGGYQQYTYQTIQSSETFGPQTDVNQYTVQNAGNNATCNLVGGEPCLTIFPTVVTNYVQSDAWYSHEVTLASTGNSPLQWIGGLYYYHETFSNPVTADMPGQSQVGTPYYVGLNTVLPNLSGSACAPGAVSPADPYCPAGSHSTAAPTNPFGLLAAPGNPNRSLYNSNYLFFSDSKAVFGQLDWKITDTLKLTGGLRYTSDHKWGTEYERVVVFGGQTESAVLAGINPALLALVTPSLAGLLPTAIPVAYGGTGHNLTTLPALDFTQGLCSAANGGSQKGVTSHCVVNSTSGIAARSLGDTSSAVTGTAGIEWTPDSTTLGYLRYSRGYKELGFNAGSLATTPEVAPEHMDDYEIGFKKTFNRNLVVDATLFYENYLDAQFPVTVVNGGLKSTNFLSIPKARSDGFELETIWTPIDHLQLLLSYAYDDTAFETGSCNAATGAGNCYVDVINPGFGLPGNGGRQSINGNPLPNSPKNKVSLNGNYTFIFDPGDLTLSATYLWRDKQTGAIFDQSFWTSPTWDQVDLRATWRGKGDKYEIIVYGRNVFNTNGYPSGPTAIQRGDATNPTVYTIGDTYTTNPPATYGVEFHYKFF